MASTTEVEPVAPWTMRRIQDKMFRLNAWETIKPAFSTRNKNKSSISALQAAFRDPSSPFYLAPGEQGPESSNSSGIPLLPDKGENPMAEPTNGGCDDRRQILLKRGFDPESFWEQPISWGDQDAFQHVNNARYFQLVFLVSFFESARIKWMIALGEQLGGPSRARAMLNGQGISLILKSIEINFRRPVTFPDSLLIGYKVLPFKDEHDLSTFNVTASAFSLSQKAFVAHTKEAIVWYDYDQLQKCLPEDKAIEVLKRKMTKFKGPLE